MCPGVTQAKTIRRMDTTSPMRNKMTVEFTCGICEKSFCNRKSQTRHMSYCRQKAKNPIKSRKKSCSTCSRAKTQCDAAFPKCSRCLKKTLTCTYERTSHPATLHTEALKQQGNNISEPSKAVEISYISSIEDSLSHLYNDIPIFDLHNGSPTPSLNIIEALPTQSSQDPPWDIVQATGSNENGEFQNHSELSAIEFTFNQDSDSDALAKLAMSSYNLQNSMLSSSNWENLPSLWTTVDERHRIEDPGFETIMDSPEPAQRALKAFRPRRMRDHHLSLNRHFVICTLRSYPAMLLPGKALPPFIHPHWLVNVSGDDQLQYRSLPGPLASCAAIVSMWSVKNKENSGLIWNAIHAEQKRLFTECDQYNDFNTVAALQAICIYFLLRLSEDNYEVTNFDVPLIDTMLKVAHRTAGFSLKHSTPTSGILPPWKSWILVESLRRTIIIIFLVDVLFDIPTAPGVCDGTSYLRGVFLPCSRALWTAPNEAEWESEYFSRMRDPNQSNQLSYGDLIKFCSSPNSDPLSRGSPFDCWLSQVDDFGALVMAAASLPDIGWIRAR